MSSIEDLKCFEDGRQNQVSQLESDSRKVNKMPSLPRKRECRNDKLREYVIARMNADPGLGLTPKEG